MPNTSSSQSETTYISVNTEQNGISFHYWLLQLLTHAHLSYWLLLFFDRLSFSFTIYNWAFWIRINYSRARVANFHDTFNFTAFGEAFITTFRTFISPLDLIEKLVHRYTVFCCQVNDQKQKAAKESFSLLVRVVNDLTYVFCAANHTLFPQI